MPERNRIDRLWPDAAEELSLEEAFGELTPPEPRDGRPGVSLNMVTSIDGRAQLAGLAEGIGSRTDRRLMQLYRAAFDAIGSGSGTLHADDFYSRLPADLAGRRRSAGREPQPIAVLVAGRRALPLDRRWFGYPDQRRIVAVGSSSPHAGTEQLAGVETWVAPTDIPQPGWLLQRLGAEGVHSVLFEGGPTMNASLVAAGMVDELLWTIGSRLVASDGLPMLAALPEGLPEPVEAKLVSVHRHGEELFLRYRLGSIGP